MVDIGRLLGRQLATRRRWSNWSGSTSPKLCPSSPSTSLSCPTSSSTLMPGERDGGGSGDGGGDGGDGGGICQHLHRRYLDCEEAYKQCLWLENRGYKVLKEHQVESSSSKHYSHLIFILIRCQAEPNLLESAKPSLARPATMSTWQLVPGTWNMHQEPGSLVPGTWYLHLVSAPGTWHQTTFLTRSYSSLGRADWAPLNPPKIPSCYSSC